MGNFKAGDQIGGRERIGRFSVNVNVGVISIAVKIAILMTPTPMTPSFDNKVMDNMLINRQGSGVALTSRGE